MKQTDKQAPFNMRTLEICEEYRDLLLPLTDEEFNQLEANILKDGYIRNNIVIHGCIIDGHHRYKIAQKHNIPFEIDDMSLLLEDRVAVMVWMINLQLGTRSLSPFYRTELEWRRSELKQEKAKDRQRLGGKLKANLPEASKGEVRDEVAEKADISPRSAQKVKNVVEAKDKEVIDKARKGEISISEAEKQIKQKKQKEAQKQKKIEYVARVEKKQKSDFVIDIHNTEERFRVVYADPAWSYNDKQDTAQLGGAQKHYDTMSTSAICNLPIESITEKNAVLFLWVTSPLLEDGLKVIDAWGFKYKTSFIWDKMKHNMGHYNSVRHEFLLVATKGSCVPDNKTLVNSVQSIERNDKHSEKPIEFINIIDMLYEHGNRIELFCRNIKKHRWYGWGNEL